MEEKLSERLLSIELGWDIEIAQNEISKIRYLAAVKYDGYRNFEPGRRFMESLVLWLRNFDTRDEKISAYQFAMNRMVYISETQMDHLVGLLYPQRIFPILCDQAVEKIGIDPYHKRKIRNSEAFKVLERKTLFLGMSDGARMDAFRRKNSLINEQISVSHELSKEKWQRMQDDLEEWLNEHKIKSQPVFENVFLIDDFSGSGNSILRRDNGEYKGKLSTFVNDSLKKAAMLGKYCGDSGIKLFVVTYLSTRQALNQLHRDVIPFIESHRNSFLSSCTILDPMQILEEYIKVPQEKNGNDLSFNNLLDKYYDERLHDKYTETGGKDVKHGYADCSLPLVLCHNCPNNSVYLLWGQTEKLDTRKGLKALFPRISRHLEGR